MPPPSHPPSAAAGGGRRDLIGPGSPPLAQPPLVRGCTKHATGPGKPRILASVLDMASRRIVRFALSEHHDAERAYAAMVMAMAIAIAVRGLLEGNCRPGAAH